jgi:ribosome-associated translation inhibitor RaiA
MGNTEKTKKLVQEAIRQLPEDFALRDARYYMTRALTEIQNVEKKRSKRGQQEEKLTPRQKWEMDLQTGNLVRPELTSQQKHDVLAQIDSLIDEQEKKIQKARQKDEGESDLLTD